MHSQRDALSALFFAAWGQNCCIALRRLFVYFLFCLTCFAVFCWHKTFDLTQIVDAHTRKKWEHLCAFHVRESACRGLNRYLATKETVTNTLQDFLLPKKMRKKERLNWRVNRKVEFTMLKTSCLDLYHIPGEHHSWIIRLTGMQEAIHKLTPQSQSVFLQWSMPQLKAPYNVIKANGCLHFSFFLTVFWVNTFFGLKI